jgi:hypothetical protein
VAKGTDLEDEIRKLYRAPLDEFVSERDAAAKRLRDAGEADAAREVKALRKPNLPAWGINRAVAANPGAARELFEAAERLEAAQAEALEGDASGLRAAMAEHADAVERLVEVVEEGLAGAGGTGAVDRARETLRAAAADAELRSELAAGRLARDREAVGLAGAAVGSAPKRSAKPKTKKRAKEKGPSATERKRAEQRLRRTERAVEAAASRLKDAERRLERARRGVSEAEDELADAQRELSAREAELDEARAAMPS